MNRGVEERNKSKNKGGGKKERIFIDPSNLNVSSVIYCIYYLHMNR